MTADQIISASASVAALLAASATFLTVWQIAKQRRASYKPELVISANSFDTKSPKDARGIWSYLDWREQSTSQKPATNVSLLGTSFRLRLVNIGLGAAKDVSIRWEFPFESTIGQINELARSANLPIPIEFKNDRVSTSAPQVTSFWDAQNQDQLDYVLPASVERDPFYLRIPHAYILTTAAAIYVYFHPDAETAEGFKELSIPPLSVSL
jgi:hypothetical protein